MARKTKTHPALKPLTPAAQARLARRLEMKRSPLLSERLMYRWGKEKLEMLLFKLDARAATIPTAIKPSVKARCARLVERLEATGLV